MKIAVFNIKGGVGKTAIALNIAMKNSLGIITNDVLYPYEKFIPEKSVLKVSPTAKFPSIPDDYKVVYDLGGYSDPRVPDILEDVRVVLVPTTCKDDQIEITQKALQNIEQYTDKILVIANNLKPGEFFQVQKKLKTLHPVLPLNHSKGFERLKEQKKCIQDLADSPLLKSAYKNVIAQLNDIDDAIKQYGGL